MRVPAFVPFALFFFAFATAQNVVDELETSAKTIYLITTPQLYSNSEENVCISFFKQLFQSPVEINVQLKSPPTFETIYENKKSLATLSDCVRVSVNNVTTESVLLQVLIGNVINDTRVVAVRRKSSFTLIETPKNVYKPGDEVEFRVFSFNQWMKPVDDEFEIIWIEDSSFAPVMQWTNVLNSKGLLSYKLQLAEDCNVGLWRIKTLSKSQKLTEKTITINRIVQPRIKINVENTTYLLPSDTERVLNVCIKNEFGYPLKGELDTFIGYRRPLGQQNDDTLPFYTNSFQVNDDGCVKITLNQTVLRWDEVAKRINIQTLNVFLEFMENKTGFTESRNVELITALQPIRIAFPSPSLVHHYFKPGLPYFTYLLAENPDFSPAANEEFNVCYNIRIIPWVETDNEICKKVTSNADGVILLDIPAMKRDVSQVVIRVSSARFDDVANFVSLESWFTTAERSMTIKPLHESICKGPLNIEVYISNDTSAEKSLYYQLMGPNSLQTPQIVTLSLQPYVYSMPEGLDEPIKIEQQLPPVKRGVLSIPLPSSLPPYSILDRIVLYYVNEKGRLVTDSTAFFLDCLNEGNVQIKMETNNANKVEMQLENKPADSICAVDISSHEKRKELTKRRMMHLLEAFNVVSQPDRCHEQRLEMINRNMPYSQTMSPHPVVDFHSAWDSFNDIGVSVSSNVLVDDSPCEKDFFPQGVSPNILEGFRNHQRLMGLRFSKSNINHALLTRLEREVVDDVMHSSLVTTQQVTMDADISRKLYGNAICISKSNGIHFGDKYLDVNSANAIKISLDLPTKIVPPEEIPVSIYIQKEVDGCVPVQINVQNSPKYIIKQVPKAQCVCKNTLVTALLRPKVLGKITVQVSAKSATVSSSFTCNDVQTETFASVSDIGTVIVIPSGVHNKEYNATVYCSEDKLQFNVKKTPSTKKATITTDLLHYITSSLKEQNSNPSVVDLLSRIAFISYALNSPNVKIGVSVKNSLKKELAREYQELLNYRYLDGSFSITRRKDFHSGIAFTVEAFKIMTEFKKAYSKPIREIYLQQTLNWIYAQQEVDGCFYRYTGVTNIWPNNLDSTLQTTAFVTASLLESGLNMSSVGLHERKPLSLTTECINSQLLVREYSDLTLAILAYIDCLKGDTSSANNRLNELLNRAVVSDSQIYWNSENSKETAGYAILSYLKVKDNEKAVKVARWLVQQQHPFQSSVSAVALIEVSPLFSQSSNLKLKLKNKNAVALANAAIQNIPLTSDAEAELQGKGCAILQVDKIEKFTEESKNYFDITVDRVEQGFSTCRKRLLRVCIKEIGNQRFNSSIIKVNYASGFVVDERALIPRLTTRNIISDFKIRDSYLLLYLRPFYNVPEPECFDIPFNQRQVVPNLRPAYIQAYDYYNQKLSSNHFSDVVKYSFPNECNITREISHTKRLNSAENPQSVRRFGEEHLDPIESLEFKCPAGVVHSCPDCRSSHHHHHTNSICSHSFAAVINKIRLRRPMLEYSITYEHAAVERHESKKCIAVPLRVRRTIHMTETARSTVGHAVILHFYMLEDCKCEFVTKQSKGEGMVIVNDLHRKLNSNAILFQLTDKDVLINLPLGDSKFPKCF